MFTESLVKNTGLQDHFGVEIEVELENSWSGRTGPEWRCEGDGSLRRNGVEFVFRDPLELKTALKAVKKLLKDLEKDNKVLDTGRAGVHVHVNVGDLRVRELINFIAIVHILDELMNSYCGVNRKGNLFCLGMLEADYVVDKVREYLSSESVNTFCTDEIRYSSVNLKAIYEYGSVEFRAMRSDGDAEAICNWILLLNHLKQVAKTIDNPVQIVHQASELNPTAYVDHLLGDFRNMLPRPEGFDVRLYDAIQQVQHYAYAKEW